MWNFIKIKNEKETLKTKNTKLNSKNLIISYKNALNNDDFKYATIILQSEIMCRDNINIDFIYNEESKKYSLLSLACFYGRIQDVIFLINHHAQLDLLPLYLSYKNNGEKVKQLLENESSNLEFILNLEGWKTTSTDDVEDVICSDISIEEYSSDDIEECKNQSSNHRIKKLPGWQEKIFYEDYLANLQELSI